MLCKLLVSLFGRERLLACLLSPSSSVLLPCPFCGSVPKMYGPEEEVEDGVWCMTCDIGFFEPEAGEAGMSMIEFWNRRV